MSTKKNQKDELGGFLANPQALQRGGLAVRALWREGTAVGITEVVPRWEPLERMSQVEVNRFLRAEIASKKGTVDTASQAAQWSRSTRRVLPIPTDGSSRCIVKAN